MMMPEMDGISTIHILKRMNPQVQIVAMSGLPPNKAIAHTVGSSCSRIFVQALHGNRSKVIT